jgi:hypothetical protein
MKKPRILIAFGIASLMGAMSLGAPAMAAPSPAPVVPHRAAAAPVRGGLASPRSCAYLQAHRRELSRAGGTRAGCLTRDTGLVKARAGRAATAPAAVFDLCAGQASGDWVITRTEACMKQDFGYIVYDLNNGDILAGALLHTSEDIELNTNFWEWDELVTLSMDTPFGIVALLDVFAAWDASCTSPCVPLDTAFTGGWAELSPGVSVDGSLTLGANVGVDAADTMFTADTLTIDNPVVTEAGGPPLSGSWGNPHPVRCDDQLGEGGCVLPDFVPTLVLPESQYGASAAMIVWSQVNQGGWGLPFAGPPLHRLADPGQTNANRNAICDGTFVPDPNVPSDSCDEFPFASSRESGAMSGLTGADCAEVEPVFDPSSGVWVVNVLNGIVNAGCTRGHVPLSQNSAVGGALGNFITENRVLDRDPYLVQVTLP